MFHSLLSTFFTPSRGPFSLALPGDAYLPQPGPRERHAQALAYAARRRRAALAASMTDSGPDTVYWKAGVPAALARAASIRRDPCFSRLP